VGPFQPLQEIRLDRQANSLTGQQSLDAVSVPGPVFLQRRKLPVQLAIVLILHTRYPHHAPHLLLTAAEADQLPKQLAHIHVIGLGPTLPSVHLDTGGVHHQVLHPLRYQIPVEPKPIPTRFVAAQDRCLLWQSKAPLRTPDFALERRQVPSRNVALPGPLPHSDGETQLPVKVAQFEGEIENWSKCAILVLSGRCHDVYAPSLSDQKELISSDPLPFIPP
jgi:hypothetical protein